MNNRKWIGSDVDGVIFDVRPMYIDVLNRLLGTDITLASMGEDPFTLEEKFNTTEEVATAAVNAALSTGEYPLIPGARALWSICRFRGVCTLPVFITRRRQLFYRVTKEALHREFGPHFALYCHDGRPKSEIVKEYALDYFIEDGPKYAIDIACHTPCKVYLLNNPYNQTMDDPLDAWVLEALIKRGRIERVNNWLEIGVKIHRDIKG